MSAMQYSGLIISIMTQVSFWLKPAIEGTAIIAPLQICDELSMI